VQAEAKIGATDTAIFSAPKVVWLRDRQGTNGSAIPPA
jgi:hypothetical protein